VGSAEDYKLAQKRLLVPSSSKEREKRIPVNGDPNSKKQYSDVRVIQRNLVYVTNLALSAAKEELLRRQEYFGRFGKILKIVINRNHVYSGPQGPSVSAYITYTSNAHAYAAIKAMDGTIADGRVLRASFGTTKYCTYFLRNVRCPNPDCMYLHDVGATVDSFTKEDMSQGKHLLSNKPTAVTSIPLKTSGSILNPNLSNVTAAARVAASIPGGGGVGVAGGSGGVAGSVAGVAGALTASASSNPKQANMNAEGISSSPPSTTTTISTAQATNPLQSSTEATPIPVRTNNENNANKNFLTASTASTNSRSRELASSFDEETSWTQFQMEEDEREEQDAIQRARNHEQEDSWTTTEEDDNSSNNNDDEHVLRHEEELREEDEEEEEEEERRREEARVLQQQQQQHMSLLAMQQQFQEQGQRAQQQHLLSPSQLNHLSAQNTNDLSSNAGLAFEQWLKEKFTDLLSASPPHPISSSSLTHSHHLSPPSSLSSSSSSSFFPPPSPPSSSLASLSASLLSSSLSTSAPSTTSNATSVLVPTISSAASSSSMASVATSEDWFSPVFFQTLRQTSESRFSFARSASNTLQQDVPEQLRFEPCKQQQARTYSSSASLQELAREQPALF